MNPRRDIFANDYAIETVNKYLAVSESENYDADLIKWSHDVLTEYFSVVERSPEIDTARQLFHDAGQSISGDNEAPKRPFLRNLSEPTDISIDDLHKLAKRRRSCRWFKQQPVPRDMIDKALSVAALSPSACNRQPFRFRVYDDPKLAQAIGSISMGTSGFSQNFPCLVVLVGELNAFPNDRDRHVPYIDASLAIMAFQFALEVQGVSSCCINWPDVKDREETIAAKLNLKPEERVVMLLAFGFPDKTSRVPYSQKKPLSELRSFNEE